MSESNGKSVKAAKAPKSAKNGAKKGTTGVVGVSFLNLPAAKRVTLKCSEPTFDRRLQHRTKLVDEETAEYYASVLKDALDNKKPNPFPALCAIMEGEGKGAKYWVYDGFQRGSAYELVGLKECEVDVIPGTYQDAFFLSLKSNSQHGKNRTGDDKRRAVYALIDDEAAFALVQAKAKGNGGLHRVMSAALGISVGWIASALADRGLAVKADKLVKARAKPSAHAGQGVSGPATSDSGIPASVPVSPVPQAPVSEEAQKAANDAAYAALCQAAYRDRLNEGQKLVKRLGVLISTLATDREHGESVNQVMQRHGISISEEFDVKQRSQGDAFEPYYEIQEHWPVANKLGMFFRELIRASEPATDNTEPAVEQATTGKGGKGAKKSKG